MYADDCVARFGMPNNGNLSNPTSVNCLRLGGTFVYHFFEFFEYFLFYVGGTFVYHFFEFFEYFLFYGVFPETDFRRLIRAATSPLLC